MVRVWWLVALAACGRIDFDPQAGTDGNQSGTRLKLQWYAFEDGTRQIAGVYDSVRGEPCEIALYDDGTARCAPTQGTLSSIAYSDAACTQPVAYNVPSSCSTAPPIYAVVELEQPGCSYQRQVAPLGAKLALATMYMSIAGTCQPSSTSGYDVYAIGTPIAATDLAEVSLVATGSGRLQARYYESTDGFREQGDVYDTTLASRCFLVGAGTSDTCQPDATAALWSADAQCSVLEVGFPHACPTPYAAIGVAGCPPQSSRFFTLGPQAVTPPSYSVFGTTCVLFNPPAGDDFYMLGTEVQPVVAQRAPAAVPGHRLEVIYDDAPGFHMREGAPMLLPVLYDTVLATECYPWLASDGSYRCLPLPTVATPMFTDAACTQPVSVVIDPGVTGCATPPPPPYAFVPTGACEQSDTYSVGAAYSGPLYQMAAACTPHPRGPNEVDYLTGAILPPSQMAAATIVTEP
jgi:hypothetical protein